MNLIKEKWEQEDCYKLVDYLKSLADEKYRTFHAGLVPEINEFFGVRVPVLRKIAKDISKGNFYSFLKNIRLNSSSPYEIRVIYGLVLGVSKADIKFKLGVLIYYIPYINNWAVCDVVVSSLKFIGKNKKDCLKTIESYYESANEFEVRFAVVCLLDYYLVDEYFDYCLNVFSNISHSGYYAKMAVAWAISVAYVKQNEKTLAFLKNNNLDTFTFNKSIQKMCESLRVSEDDKTMLKSMKVKNHDK